jgi:hypothetical protein
MCWRAIVDGAIKTRTLFRMAQHRTHTTENITRGRSGPFQSQDDARVSDALIAIERIHLLG